MAERKPQVPEEHKKRVRRERIAELKAEIEAGAYTVDAQALSRKIVDAHLVQNKNKADC